MASIALLAGLGGLALGVYALVRVREAQGDYRALAQRALASAASGSDPRAVRDVAVLHYDALEEMSGARSFSLAMLNSYGDGVVMTSINGRTESRTYAKALTRGEADSLLSPEEYRVIRAARLGNGIGAGPPGPALPETGTTESTHAHGEEDGEDQVTLVQGPERAQRGGPDGEAAQDGAAAGARRGEAGDRSGPEPGDASASAEPGAAQPAESGTTAGPRAPKPRPES